MSLPTKTPTRRSLLLGAAILLVSAAAIAAAGLTSRARTNQELTQWTNAQTVPTVALAQLTTDAAAQPLILPGTIQPDNKPAIYARVTGYLKSSQQSIDAHVTAEQALATF